MSKYLGLWNYLKENDKDKYELSFLEIERILGFPIDHSFLKYKKEALDYGYEIVKIFLKEKKVLFKKI